MLIGAIIFVTDRNVVGRFVKGRTVPESLVRGRSGKFVSTKIKKGGTEAKSGKSILFLHIKFATQYVFQFIFHE